MVGPRIHGTERRPAIAPARPDLNRPAIGGVAVYTCAIPRRQFDAKQFRRDGFTDVANQIAIQRKKARAPRWSREVPRPGAQRRGALRV